MKSIMASTVKIGDTICFDRQKHNVTIERISEATCDGAVGLHANNETWHSYYKPTDWVRVLPR